MQSPASRLSQLRNHPFLQSVCRSQAYEVSLAEQKKIYQKGEKLRNIISFLLIALLPLVSAAQVVEAIPMDEECEVAEIEILQAEENPVPVPAGNPYKFRGTDLIAPCVMLGVGIAGLGLKPLKHLNHDISDKLWSPDRKEFKIDNFTQYLPAVAVYGLNLCGVKGEHDYVDLTIIMGTAYLMMAAIVYPAKDFIHSPRPSGVDNNSFPSGHSAWAFTGAEIMRREFWKVSPWIGVSGYLIAAGTGFMRLYNGAHWLTDVLAGAGIGILCAEAAYWLYPAVTKALFPKRYKSNIFLSPTATTTSLGLACSITF